MHCYFSRYLGGYRSKATAKVIWHLLRNGFQAAVRFCFGFNATFGFKAGEVVFLSKDSFFLLLFYYFKREKEGQIQDESGNSDFLEANAFETNRTSCSVNNFKECQRKMCAPHPSPFKPNNTCSSCTFA